MDDAGTGEFQGLIPCPVHADHADEGQDHILAGDVGPQLPREMDVDGGGDLEPGLPGSHSRAHIRRTHAGGEGPQRAVRTGMGVRADDALAGGHQPLFRQERVFDAHGAHIIVVLHVELPCEGAALGALGGGLDVLVGDEVVHDKGNLAPVKDVLKTGGLKFVDGDGGGDVVAQDEIQFCLNELSGADLLHARVACQDFLCHRHAHGDSSLLSRIGSGYGIGVWYRQVETRTSGKAPVPPAPPDVNSPDINHRALIAGRKPPGVDWKGCAAKRKRYHTTSVPPWQVPEKAGTGIETVHDFGNL